MQEFHCEGIWWLPTAASDQVGGTLTFSHTSGLTLSLFGVLGETTSFTTEKVIPVILGIAWDCPVGQLLTLTNCRQVKLTMGLPGINREAYHCERLFAGAHLEQEEDFLFSRAVVELSGLSSWADCLTGFIRSEEEDERKVGLKWHSPEGISGPIPGGNVSLFVEAIRSWARRKSSIEEVVRFSIECNEPLSAEEIDKAYVHPLQNFLTLVTDHPNAIVEFSVRQSNKRNPIKLIYAMVYYEPPRENVLPYKMLFTLADIREHAMGLVARWVELSDQLGDILSPYFGIQYKPDSFVDIKFLMISQSLEAYQRRRSVKHKSETAGWQLADLFRQILQEHWETIGPLFNQQLEDAVKEVISFRSFIVHGNSDLGKDPDYGRQLYWLVQKLMFLMKACLLSELGMEVGQQSYFLNRNQMYAHILSLANR